MKVHLKGEQPILVPVDKIDSVQFIVSEPVREFTLSPEQVELQVGDTRQLTVVVTPADANYSVSYESNDATVATVTAEGLVQALAAGTATITATIGKLQKQCSVTVLAPAQLLTTLTPREQALLPRTAMTLQDCLLYGVQRRLWSKTFSRIIIWASLQSGLESSPPIPIYV